jgi:hypothetical protein
MSWAVTPLGGLVPPGMRVSRIGTSDAYQNEVFSLGIPFLGNVYTVLPYDTGEIGFAELAAGLNTPTLEDERSSVQKTLS